MNLDISCKENYNNIVQLFPEVNYQAIKKALQCIRKRSSVVNEQLTETATIETYNDWFCSFHSSEYVIPEDELQRYSHVEVSVRNSRFMR